MQLVANSGGQWLNLQDHFRTIGDCIGALVVIQNIADGHFGEAFAKTLVLAHPELPTAVGFALIAGTLSEEAERQQAQNFVPVRAPSQPIPSVQAAPLTQIRPLDGFVQNARLEKWLVPNSRAAALNSASPVVQPTAVRAVTGQVV